MVAVDGFNSADAAHGTSKFVRLGSGSKSHYSATAGAGPPVLFLHGYIDSSHSFESLIASFSRPLRTYSIDWRGHGESEPAESYAIADLAADAIEFLERVILAPAHIVGHSMGSIVAQRVAALRPDLVLKLALIGAAPTAAGHAGLESLRAEIAEFDADVPVPFVEAFQRSTVHAPIPEPVIKGYIAESLKVGLGAWRGALDGLLDESVDVVRPVGAPALVLWGEKDGLFGADAQQDLGRLLLRHRFVHCPDAGHAPHWEFPARVAADIETFLRDQ